MPQHFLTDRDERALVAAAEHRICEPLRVGAALAVVGRLLSRRLGRPGRPGRPGRSGRSEGGAQGRESLTCQPM
ncbi:hypothetical protein [Streptomyces sp. RerS4]|uniref:hypothetical protein n=1 Tax=Streptomyces sp. RerS4 TaxID=2942449 RepID=UPI00201BFDD9|nr:hypothetical protein [Streptomyces sp. RerS4]UQX03729.1 hypothetical protein M4D82_26970 [Streptomyces sp. RerS4]